MTIAGRSIGAGHPAWVVIELGVTHEGSFAVAKELIEAAAAAEVDAVKVECIDRDRLVAPAHRADLMYEFTSFGGQQARVNYYELLAGVSLTRDEISNLRAVAASRGLPFFGTAFDRETVDFLVSIDACAVKISSGEITHHPLIRHAAGSGLPLIMDTGRSTLAEILAAVGAARDGGCATPMLMHNPSGYPAPPSDVDLPTLQLLQATLELPVGFSCHTRGLAMSLAAVASGADAVEKPISRDNTRAATEHVFALNVDEVADFVREIRDVEAAMVKHPDKVVPAEPPPTMFRQSLVAARDLPGGHVLTQDDVTFARPGFGIPPGRYDEVIGAKCLADIPAGHLLSWTDLLVG